MEDLSPSRTGRKGAVRWQRQYSISSSRPCPKPPPISSARGYASGCHTSIPTSSLR
ncbi:hypothetical protein HMPREF9588_02068 [Cutibacterium acnes HL025PA2]|nr:hypothetical protein HMPREF9588_02068 [Cutibacterium acnes HL025PA2]